jgi:hypothetical protein
MVYILGIAALLFVVVLAYFATKLIVKYLENEQSNNAINSALAEAEAIKDIKKDSDDIYLDLDEYYNRGQIDKLPCGDISELDVDIQVYRDSNFKNN